MLFSDLISYLQCVVNLDRMIKIIQNTRSGNNCKKNNNDDDDNNNNNIFYAIKDLKSGLIRLFPRINSVMYQIAFKVVSNIHSHVTYGKEIITRHKDITQQ